MRRVLSLILVCLSAQAHRDPAAACATAPETAAQQLFLHRQSTRRLAARPRDASSTLPDSDIGNIAVIHDRGDIVVRQNQFNLDGYSLTFTPAGASYRYSAALGGYDAAAAQQAAPLAALDDDDARAFALPFTFPFFGFSYSQVYVNSDGNLTFLSGDSASTPRQLSRMTAGPPRIAPLFDDLDPSRTAGGVRVSSSPSRMVVSWVAVPEYSDSGNGTPQTFQATLFPDGRILFAWQGVSPIGAVVGIAPGSLQGTTQLVDYRNDASALYSAALAEVFSDSLTIDAVRAAQRFFDSHEDAYDYVVIYNDMDVPALGEGTVAYEQTVRNLSASGYGVAQQDSGAELGSASRLQALLNLGPLSQYPADPSALVPARAPQGDTPLTVLTHEAGHLFLAFASVRDSSGAQPMLGYQNVHWSFLYDSEASVMEGERIVDRGASASPRFQTTDTVKQYSPLDQYLMGFRSATDVPDTFYVANPTPNFPPTLHPYSGFFFDGERQNVTAAAVIATVGRRTPDFTLAQRRFRFAFILVAPQNAQPSAAELAQIDAYRQNFEAFYPTAASGNATADTSLRHSLTLSLFPWSGLVQGAAATATLDVSSAPASPLAIQLSAPNGYASAPSSVTIAAGATTASFLVTGIKPGVEALTAAPSDPAYETAVARLQVADASVLNLVVEQLRNSSDVTVRLTDSNAVRYAQVPLVAVPSADGAVVPAQAVTDVNGEATFHWTPGPAAASQLRISVASVPAVSTIVKSGAGVPGVTAVINAASFLNALSPGALGTIVGANLSGASVALNGRKLLTGANTGSALTFYIPPDSALGPATLTVTSPAAVVVSAPVTLALTSPGIFTILHNGANASTTPVHPGDALEIYGTGLGPVAASGDLSVTSIEPVVFLGATPVAPFFSGLAPGQTGVYQINLRVPAGLAPGTYPLIVSSSLAHSNTVSIQVQ